MGNHLFCEHITINPLLLFCVLFMTPHAWRKGGRIYMRIGCKDVKRKLKILKLKLSPKGSIGEFIRNEIIKEKYLCGNSCLINCSQPSMRAFVYFTGVETSRNFVNCVCISLVASYSCIRCLLVYPVIILVKREFHHSTPHQATFVFGVCFFIR